MVAAKLALPHPILCLVTDRGLCRDLDDLASRVVAAVDGGVNMVQVREKGLDGKPLLLLTERVIQRVAGRALVLVNDRVDVAMATGAGIHLPEASLPVAEVRRMAGEHVALGRSVHSLDAALQAEGDGADYLIAGTMFATRSHPGESLEGPALMRRIADSVRIPVLGIGGIGDRNAVQVIASGASGVAVISSILATSDPSEAASRLRRALTQRESAGVR
ncbi:MAG: thiamine phosphate synthase [Chloroflexi bacterium]|nr:thiamine phosphate synthase [Chloroflexota bacterium]